MSCPGRGSWACEYAKTLDAIDQAVALEPNIMWFQLFRFYALMFLDRTNEARAIFLQFRGRNLERSKSRPETLWKVGIVRDFERFRDAGHTHPLMGEIKELIAEGK